MSRHFGLVCHGVLAHYRELRSIVFAWVPPIVPMFVIDYLVVGSGMLFVKRQQFAEEFSFFQRKRSNRTVCRLARAQG